MPKLADLPDINFVELDKDEVEKEVFDLYYTITGRSELAKGDPVRLFLLFIVNLIILLLNKLNDTGRMNLLKHSRDDYLEGLGALVGTTRLPASGASVILQITLSEARTKETIIPQGTRVSPIEGDIYFATTKDVLIIAGETTAQVTAVCTENGAMGNGYKPGEINKIVDPVAYVASMVNISTSEGGADVESDDSLRERIFEAPESYSCAGPEGAYSYYAKSMSNAVIDVATLSPAPGEVRVVILLTGGTIPKGTVLTEIEEKLSQRNIRPLTDNLFVTPPDPINYDINFQYWLTADADAAKVSAKVWEAVEAYRLWQRTKLGRDINPDELIYMLKDISGVKRVNIISPSFTVLTASQVAQEQSINVALQGSEDE